MTIFANLPPGLNPMSLFDAGPSLAAVLQALETMVPGGVGTLQMAVPPEPGNTINIYFNHVPTVSNGGVIYTFIQSKFPTLDMAALISNANGITI